MSNRRTYNQVLPAQFEDAFGLSFTRLETGENILQGRKLKSPYVGENWQASLKFKNLFSFGMENIRLQVCMEQNRRRLATLYDSNNKAHRTVLKPQEMMEFSVEHLFDTLADFQVVIILSCQTADGSDSRRYTHILEISSLTAVSFRVNRQTIHELLLVEVIVCNSLKSIVAIEKVEVEPVSMFECVDLNQIDMPAELSPNLSRAYLFQLNFKNKSDPINQAALMAGSIKIFWKCGDRVGSVKSELQQRERLNARLSPELNVNTTLPNMEISILKVPDKVILGDVFEIPIEIRNNEDFPIEMFLEFRTNVATSIIPYGKSSKNYLGVIQPRSRVRESIWYVGLACGIQSVNGIQATIKTKRSRKNVLGKFGFLYFIEVVENPAKLSPLEAKMDL